MEKGTPTLKKNDLLNIINKHSENGFVDWNAVKKAAESSVFQFRAGANRINSIEKIVDDAKQRITKKNRYCKTFSELARRFNISRSTLYSWGYGGVVSLKYSNNGWDAFILLKQLEAAVKRR